MYFANSLIMVPIKFLLCLSLLVTVTSGRTIAEGMQIDADQGLSLQLHGIVDTNFDTCPDDIIVVKVSLNCPPRSRD